ncbi:DUF5672 family protein [Oxalobacteraceae bacterium A2-2]
MTAPKLELPDVSLVCVETRHPQLARYAIDRCRAAANFRECRLLAPSRFELPDYIEQVAIAPINTVEAYSDFMLRELGRHFSGSHVLVVQWDSFILHGERWDARFLGYDYIGAPWAHRPAAVAVGNGGFSLRSRRLVDALAGMAFGQVHPEDYVICEQRRAELEARGMRFAPLEVARRFAFETVRPDGPSFGFHGLFNFHRALDDRQLEQWLALCDQATLRTEPARRLVRHLYHDGRHAMALRLLRRRLGGTPGQVAETLLLAARCQYHRLTARGPAGGIAQ